MQREDKARIVLLSQTVNAPSCHPKEVPCYPEFKNHQRFEWEGDISQCFRTVTLAMAQGLDNEGKGHLVSLMAVIESHLFTIPPLAF